MQSRYLCPNAFRLHARTGKLANRSAKKSAGEYVFSPDRHPEYKLSTIRRLLCTGQPKLRFRDAAASNGFRVDPDSFAGCVIC